MLDRRKVQKEKELSLIIIDQLQSILVFDFSDFTQPAIYFHKQLAAQLKLAIELAVFLQKMLCHFPAFTEIQYLIMLKIFKSKTFIGIICLLLAAVIAFLLLPRFYAARSTVRSVVRVSKDVPAGTTLTADMLSTAEVGTYGLSEKTVASVGDAVSLVALDNLYAGEYLWSDHIASAENYKAQLSEKTKGLTGSNCLVTIEFPTASAGIASVLRADLAMNNTSLIEGKVLY